MIPSKYSSLLANLPSATIACFLTLWVLKTNANPPQLKILSKQPTESLFEIDHLGEEPRGDYFPLKFFRVSLQSLARKTHSRNTRSVAFEIEPLRFSRIQDHELQPYSERYPNQFPMP
jgi:hypothetical protein